MDGDEYVAALVAMAPDFTDEQAVRLRSLLAKPPPYAAAPGGTERSR